jgi:threonine dehydratase
MVDLGDIREARARLSGRIRRTPTVRAEAVRRPAAASPGGLSLKLESLQVTGSFKARGATNRVLTLSPDRAGRGLGGLVTASGGNHGLGVAYAGWLARVPTTIYLPHNAPPAKAAQLASWGATVVRFGEVWDEADREARSLAERDGLAYVHAFADPAVVAGQGTVGLEIVEDVPGLSTVVVAIGGGGLISGVATAVKALAPGARVIGVEPVGAPTLYESVRAGALVELERITTAANTLAPRKSAELNLEIIQAKVDAIVLVTDEEMIEAARWLWQEMGIAAELSGAAAVAAWLTGRIPEPAGPTGEICAVVCGAGTAGL